MTISDGQIWQRKAKLLQVLLLSGNRCKTIELRCVESEGGERPVRRNGI